jgi:hypothetical protein
MQCVCLSVLLLHFAGEEAMRQQRERGAKDPMVPLLAGEGGGKGTKRKAPLSAAEIKRLEAKAKKKRAEGGACAAMPCGDPRAVSVCHVWWVGADGRIRVASVHPYIHPYPSVRPSMMMMMSVCVPDCVRPDHVLNTPTGLCDVTAQA